MAGAVDPTPLLRLRDGIYAADLAVAAVAELDLFTAIGDRALSSAALAAALGLAERPVVAMCDVLESLGLLERDGDSFAATPLARAYLSAGGDADLRPYFASLAERPAVRELAGVLRTGAPAAWASSRGGEDWAARLADPGFAERFTAAMDARGRVLGPALAEALGGLPFRRVLDVAGGSGIYASALLDANAELEVSVLERPPVDEVTRTLLARRGHDAIHVIAGDMFAGLPPGYDLHLFSHVLHDWDVPEVTSVIELSFGALPANGWIVDYDVHGGGRGDPSAAAFSALLMHSTEGRCYSVAEVDGLMRRAGFVDVEVRRTIGDRSAVCARRP
ncbi:MAG TPA: methyltransferase [Gaiellales bacterium]|nr:methyltransferase [Gaiellales bacterium]